MEGAGLNLVLSICPRRKNGGQVGHLGCRSEYGTATFAGLEDGKKIGYIRVALASCRPARAVHVQASIHTDYWSVLQAWLS